MRLLKRNTPTKREYYENLQQKIKRCVGKGLE